MASSRLTLSCLNVHSIRSSRYPLLHDVILSNTLGIFFRATLLPLRGSVTDLQENTQLRTRTRFKHRVVMIMKYSPNYTKSAIANRSIRMVSLRLHLRSIMSIVEDGSSLRMSCRKSHEPTTTTTLAQSHSALNPSHTLGICLTRFHRCHDTSQLHHEQLES